MTVRRTRSADFLGTPADLAPHVRAVLSSGRPYRGMREVEPDGLFETSVEPSAWLLPTRLQVRLELHSGQTLITAETISQWYILGDVGNYYGGYLDGFYTALRRAVAGHPPALPSAR
jgi:hypothetical protein